MLAFKCYNTGVVCVGRMPTCRSASRVGACRGPNLMTMEGRTPNLFFWEQPGTAMHKLLCVPSTL